MKSGIYLIKNITTNQNYVGSSYDIKNRWRQHKWDLNNGTHNNTYLQRSWNKYGAETFEFSIITNCDVENIFEIEKQYIIEYKSMIREGGFNCFDPVDLKRNNEVSEETRRFISETKLGEKNPMFGRTGKNHPKFGCTIPETSKKYLSDLAKKRVGEKASNAKLTTEQVIEIRNKYIPRIYSTTQLAEEYGVSQGTIMYIIKNRGWKHI